ncbi:hypothetical protein GOBAR_DD16271 [Gossypium barbadense]|nr:hypothetical protein GOBAR_DD16271 [Gossypium barbadense]
MVSGRKSNSTNSLECVTLFVNNLSKKMLWKGLFAFFSYHGRMLDVFISSKPSEEGHRESIKSGVGKIQCSERFLQKKEAVSAEGLDRKVSNVEPRARVDGQRPHPERWLTSFAGISRRPSLAMAFPSMPAIYGQGGKRAGIDENGLEGVVEETRSKKVDSTVGKDSGDNGADSAGIHVDVAVESNLAAGMVNVNVNEDEGDSGKNDPPPQCKEKDH